MVDGERPLPEREVMAANAIIWILCGLRRSALLRERQEQTDGQRLECFVRAPDGVAMETLVHRHAPMVWGVCRRNLASHMPEGTVASRLARGRALLARRLTQRGLSVSAVTVTSPPEALKGPISMAPTGPAAT